jgi:gliding motility-associated-like protein
VADTYTVTVTNQATGCTDSESVTITQPSPLGVSFSNTNVSCFGGNNGSSTATGSGGTPGYTFVWSNGETGPTINNLIAGAYIVTMTDANGCSIVQTTTISQPATALTVSISKTDVSCFGGNDGSATATATGGTPGFTFLWSNGANGPTANNLSAGTYVVTATDANACTAEQTVAVAEPPLLVVTTTATDVSCFGGNDGAATAVATGGTPGFTFLWSNGTNGPTANNLAAGTYVVTATDGNACTAEQTVTVAEPPLLVVTTTATDVSCFGGNDGSATATATGGTPGFTFLWSNGANGPTANNLSAGTYIVTATDANACTAEQTVTVAEPPLLVVSATANDVSCFGGNDGSATAVATGGTPGFTFLWSNGANGPTANNLSAGTYVVTATDANACTAEQTVTVAEPPLLVVTATATDVSCFGGNDGSATATATGGTPGFTFLWSNGANGPTANNLSAGTYVVTATDGNACTAEQTVAVAEPPLLVVTATATDVSCFGGNDGSATATATGGTPGFTFLWSNGANGPTANNLAAGTYIVTATDGNACTAEQTVTVAEPPLLVVTTTATDVSCFGGNDGSATAVASGGTPGFTFLWSNGANGPTANNLSTGTYVVTATDGNACTAEQTVTVAEPPLLVVTTTATDVSCFGGNDGSATAVASGGTPGFTFLWSNGANGPTANNLSAGTYVVTATDANACTAEQTVTVAEPPLLVVTATATDVSCFGGNDGSATATATGGTPGFTFLWSNGTNGPTANNLAAGTYIVTATDANACTAEQTVTVAEPPLLVVTATATDVSCFGGNDGSATAVATGGTPGFTFLWSNGANGPVADNLPAGTYTVTATDAVGCTAIQTAAITQPTLLTANAAATNVTCFGGSNGAASATGSGGTTPYTISWNTGANGPLITGLIAGIYTATVTDGNGCTAAQSATVNQPSALQISIIAADVSCFGGNDGSATATGSGGIPGYTFVWSNGANGPVADNLSAGAFTVTATDANACTTTQTIAITEPPLLNVSASATDETANNANDGTATAIPSGGTPGYNYIWSNGANTASINNLPPGLYTVTVHDSQGCSTLAMVVVNAFACTGFSVGVSGTNATCNGLANGSATANPVGGMAPLNYLWNTAATSITISNLPPGVYTVTATDASNCTTAGTATISQPPVLGVSIIGTNATCFANSNGTATATGSGGTPGYTFAWSNGATGPVATGLPAGAYTVTVSDNNGCTATQTASISQPPALSVNVGTTNATCFANSNGTATATGSGGTPGYTFAWSNGTTGSVATGLPAGAYTVTASDNNGCTATQTASISQPPALSVNVGTTNATCFGNSNGTATATGSGGTPGYTFAWSNGATGPVATGLPAGAYTVTVSDNNGCTVTQTASISQPSLLTASANATGVTCSGDSDGTASASGNGGTTPYTIFWSNSGNGPLITGLSAGTYTATVTDGNGCTSEASATVGSPPPLNVSVSATDETANNANDGTASATPSGGTPGYNYAWSNGANTATISNLPPGAYTVTVRDSRGCSRVASVVVNAFACAGLSAGITGQNATCNGLANGSVTANPVGGTDPYTYLWSTGATSKTVGSLAAGTYTVTVTDASNCTTIGATTIGQPPALALSISTTDATGGQNNGTATALPTGGTPGYQYAWSNGSTTAQISGLAPGTYTVVVRDANGCSITSTATVGSSGTSGPCTSLPPYALYAPAEVCGNDPFNLTVDDLYPAPVVQYRWILPTGDTLVSTAQSITLVATSTAYSGQYFVMRDSAGCRSVAVGGAPLTVLSLPPGAVFAGNDTTSCAAGVSVLRAKPLTQGTGKWVSLTGARVDDANANPSSARDLKPGANIFVWQVSLAACAQAAADTMVYFWETAPSASDDTYTIERAQDVAVMEVLLNDALAGIQDTDVTQIGAPASGTLEYLPDTRRFRYTAEDGYRGTVQFRYVVCNPGSVCGYGCDTALVTIQVLSMPSVPEALVVEDPGANGKLTIRNINSFTRVEISIFNRWGDLVFEEKNYRNDNPWLGDYNRSGKHLPSGAYYYFLNAFEDNQQVGNTQTGVIHLFDGNGR